MYVVDELSRAGSKQNFRRGHGQGCEMASGAEGVIFSSRGLVLLPALSTTNATSSGPTLVLYLEILQF